MHSTSNLICNNYELMKNKTFYSEHVRLNNTELLVANIPRTNIKELTTVVSSLLAL